MAATLVWMMFYLNSYGDLKHEPSKVAFATQAECVAAAEVVNKQHHRRNPRFCLHVYPPGVEV